jgi:hypothetical protein
MDQIAKDNVRSWALAAACAGFVGIPSLGALFGEGEQTPRYDTVITPPDYAFVVWAPIFAGCVASTIAQCRPGGRHQFVSRRTGWPLAGAYAVNAGWSLAAQSGRFAWTPVLLPMAAGFAAVAHARLQRAGMHADARLQRAGTHLRLPNGVAGPGHHRDVAAGHAHAGRQLAGTQGNARLQLADRQTRSVGVTSGSTGLLLGWTALASAVNIAAGAVLAGASRSSPRTVGGSAAGLLAASGAVAGVVAGSDRGRVPLAAASGWGLVTIAATSRRPLGVRMAAALGAAGITAAALMRRAVVEVSR